MRTIRNLRWYILVLVGLGTLVNYIDRNTLGVLAPVLRQELNFTTEQYSFIVASFQICYSLMQPVAGYLIDFIGLRSGYFLFALLWGTAAVLHAFAGSWQSMAMFRGMLGLAEAAAIPGAVKTVSIWFPPKERSIAAGWFNTGSSVGAMITPPLVVWLSVTWGWQEAFVVTGGMAVLVAVIWLVFFRTPEQHPYLSAAEREYITPGGETKLPKPSVGKILGRKQFWGIAAARFLTEPAWQTFSFWIPLYMVSTRGMDIKQFALFAWLPFLGADLGCIVGGYLAPFFHRRGLTLTNSRIAGIAVGAVCMIGPGLIGMVSSPIMAILLFSLGGFAHQMLSSLLYAVTADTFDKQEVATATGLAGMAGYFGGTLFTLVVGQLATTIGYEPLFACLSIFDLVAVLIVWFVLGDRGRARPDPAHPAATA